MNNLKMEKMNTIDLGDKVRHKSDNSYNALQMEVREIEDDKILCDYFDNTEKLMKEKWFNENEIELVQKAEGGFL
jgi:hypothetical protein